jgi:hypothetical protein
MMLQKLWLTSTGTAHHKATASWALSGFLFIALMIAGCGATTRSVGRKQPTSTPSPYSAASSVDRIGPTLILRNPSPNTLDVSLSLTFDQLSGAVESMTEVGLGFMSGGEDISFGGDEHVSCSGVEFPLKDRAAVFQALRAPTAQVVGTTLRCDYAVGGTVASVSLQIPSPPEITSPQQGAQSPRSAQTRVTYTFDPATASDIGLVALAPGSQPPKVTAKMNTPGPRQATVDTSGFLPSLGTLVLSASLAPHITTSGSSFKSVNAFGMATAAVDVMWM